MLLRQRKDSIYDFVASFTQSVLFNLILKLQCDNHLTMPLLQKHEVDMIKHNKNPERGIIS